MQLWRRKASSAGKAWSKIIVGLCGAQRFTARSNAVALL
jgi:hypothetical protein